MKLAMMKPTITETFWLIPNKKIMLCGYTDMRTGEQCLKIHDFATSDHMTIAVPNCVVDGLLDHYGAARSDLVESDGVLMHKFAHNMFCRYAISV